MFVFSKEKFLKDKSISHLFNDVPEWVNVCNGKLCERKFNEVLVCDGKYVHIDWCEEVKEGDL